MKTYHYCQMYCPFIVLVFNCLGLLAQRDQFVPITRPLNSISYFSTDIEQDKLGFLWVTGAGLARYDGYEWKTYLHDPKNPNSIATNMIESVCPNSNGLVWIGTKGSGLDCLDPTTDQVTHYFLKGKKTYNLNENYITVLHEGKDGTLWIGTYDGLYSRDPIVGRFTHYQANPQDLHSLSHHQVRAIFEDRQGAIWVGTGDPASTKHKEGGLNRLDRKTGQFTQYKANPADVNSLVNNAVRAIFEDSRGNLWIGTDGDGLHTLDLKSGQFTRFPYDPAHPERLSRPYSKGSKTDDESSITFIQEDRKGNIWIGAFGGGILRFNLHTGKTTRFNPGQLGGIASDFSWASCLTKDGTMCFGTYLGQLEKFVEAPPQIPFKKMPSPVQAFYEDSASNIWLGTYNGLFVQNHRTLSVTSPLSPLHLALKNKRITSIFEDNQQQVWYSTWQQGLFCYDLKTRTVRHFQHDPTKHTSLSNITIGRVYQDRAGIIWVPALESLDRWNPTNSTFIHYRSTPDDSTSNTPIVYVLEDYTGRLWVGTVGGGVKWMNRKTGTFRHYLEEEIAVQLFEDSDHVLWVVTGKGQLYRYERSKDEFVLFEKIQGIKPLTGVKSIIEDNQHHLWLGTRVGIVRINWKRTVATFFDDSYGFPGGESVYYVSCLKTRDGELYFGGNKGFYHFYPEQLKTIQVPPPRLILSALNVFNQPVSVNTEGPLTEPIHKTKKLYLNHRQSVFSLAFVALEFANPEQVQYRYKLDNYDTDWRTSTDRLASYYKVPPGEYIFRVKAIKPGSEWVERSLPIVISPPWWQRWWAYGLWIGLLVGIIWGILQYRSAALRRENRILEEKVTLRTSQLQKSLETLKATQAQLIQSEKLASLGELTAGIAHEIQNPLNFVNNFSELSVELLEEMESDFKAGKSHDAFEISADLKQNLSKINHHGQRASAIVKGMLEHSRTGDAMNRVSTDLNALADEYLRLAYHGLRAKDSSFNATMETHFDPDLPNVEVIPQDIGRVLLNLINNAFYAVNQRNNAVETLHAMSLQYQPTVTISTQKIDNQITIKVKDNGNGIPEAIKDKIFQPFFTTKPTGQGTGLGLSLAYDIVTKGHGGALNVDSKEGIGSTFIISLPITTI